MAHFHELAASPEGGPASAERFVVVPKVVPNFQTQKRGQPLGGDGLHLQTKTLPRGDLVGGCRFSALPVFLGNERTAEEADPEKEARPPASPHYPLHISLPRLQKAPPHSSKNTASYTLLGSDHARTAPSRYTRHEYMRHADKKMAFYIAIQSEYTHYNVNYRRYI